MGTHYLIIDQGGQSTRAMVFDGRGQVLGSARMPVATERDGERRVEHPASELIDSVRQAVDAVLAGLPGEVEHLVAGLVTQRSSLAAWDRNSGQPLMPVISWQDTRGHAYLPGSDRDAGIRALTGLFPNAHYGASKMRWCIDHLPAVQQARDTGRLRFGPLAAWLVKSLTGCDGVDPANASRTLLMDLECCRWHPGLLDLFGIDRDWLPAILPSRGDYGPLTWRGQSIPLQLVNGDQSAAFNSYGPLQPGIGYVNIGTGAFVAALPGKAEPPPRLLVSPVFCDGEGCQWVCEGTVNGAASALEAVAAKGGGEDYRQMDKWPEAGERKAWGDLPLFVNAVGGLGAPWWRGDIDSHFVGEGSTRQQLLAVTESIAFLVATNVEAMKRQGIVLDKLYLSGGLANSATLCALIAAACDLPAWRSDNSEATALGALFQLAGFPDDWPDPVLHPVDTSRLDGRLVRERFRCWQALMPGLPPC